MPKQLPARFLSLVPTKLITEDSSGFPGRLFDKIEENKYRNTEIST